MVRPSLRVAKSRKVRTPSKTQIRRINKKTKKAHCSHCGAVLHGVVFGHQSKVRKTSKSERLPSRIHAGHLCSRCLKSGIKAKARATS
jgi:ribosomal protein L34E